METLLGMDYPTWWFLVLTALFSGYSILEGFDYGVGVWHLFIRDEHSRLVALGAIGPVWSGNEVWLVIGGGALFAGFPVIYATLLSAMYTPLMLFLAFIIFRAVAIEFRNKEKMMWWRRMWDYFYGISSVMLAFLIGVILGNGLHGFAIGETYDYVGSTFFAFLNPFSILSGFTILLLFMSHGAIYLLLKTEGEFYDRVRFFYRVSLPLLIILLIATMSYGIMYLDHLSGNYKRHPWLYGLLVLLLLCIFNIYRSVSAQRCFRAFVFSCLSIVMLMVIVGIAVYPNILISTLNPEYNLNIWNSSSSTKSLKILMVFVVIGMPFVLGYTAFAYRTFRGKVTIEEEKE